MPQTLIASTGASSPAMSSSPTGSQLIAVLSSGWFGSGRGGIGSSPPRESLLSERAGGEAVQPLRLFAASPDRDGDPVDRRSTLVRQRAQDRVLHEVRATLAHRRHETVVGLGDLGV